VRTRTLGVAALACLPLAACGSSEPAAAPTPTTVTVTSPAPTPTPTSEAGTFPSDQLPDATVERMFADLAEEQGYIPQFGNRTDAVELGRAICTRFDAGGSYEDVAGVLTDGGMTGAQAGGFAGMATVAFCPEHAGKVTGS
jgi:hypothetical protein